MMGADNLTDAERTERAEAHAAMIEDRRDREKEGIGPLTAEDRADRQAALDMLLNTMYAERCADGCKAAGISNPDKLAQLTLNYRALARALAVYTQSFPSSAANGVARDAKDAYAAATGEEI